MGTNEVFVGTHIVEENRFVLHELPDLANKTILDCGCGKGAYGFLMRIWGRGHLAYIVGVDISRFSMKFCKRFNIYDDLILADARFLPIKEKTFDVVLACDIIEHITKEEGECLLDEIEAIHKSIAIVTTPNGWRPEVGGIHLSAWAVKDFKKRGYRVHGIGFKAASHLRRSIGRKTGLLHGAFLYWFTPLSYLFPSIGEFLIATKASEKTD